MFNIGDVVSNYEESYIIYCPSGEDFIVVEDYGNINEQFYNESIEIKDVIHIDDLSELEKLAMHERLNYKYMCMEDTFVTYLNLLKRKLSFNDYSTINEKLISACRNFSLSSDGFDALEKAGLIQKTCINKDELEWSAERRSQSDLWTVELSSLRNESGPRFEKKYLRGEDSKEYILFDSRVESLIVEDTCGAAKLVYRSGMYFDKLKSLISVIKNSTEEKFSVFNDFGKNFEDSDRLIQLGKYACSYYTDSIGVLICLDIITCNFFIVEVTDYKDNQYTFEVLFVFSNFTEATSFFNGYVICLANVCHFEDMEYETGYRSKQLSLSQEQKTCKEKLKDGYVIGRNKLGVDLG